MDTPPAPVTLDHVEAAAARIKDRVRRTPCLRTRFMRRPVTPAPLMLKLECLQVTGSFKARGANNALLSLPDDAVARGVVTASGGNHGLAVAYAARASGTTAAIYLPEAVAEAAREKLRCWEAEVVVGGAVWDDANRAALARAETDGLTYIHPFADTTVIAGQGTVAREMLKQSPDIDVILVAVGGGGLISGIATAAKAMKPEVRVIGVEPEGAPTLGRSLEAGRLVTLEGIHTDAITLAPRRSADLNLDIIRHHVDDMVLVSDEEMRQAARWLWFEMNLGVELAGAAGVAALMSGRVEVADDQVVAAVVCGAGTAAFP